MGSGVEWWVANPMCDRFRGHGAPKPIVLACGKVEESVADEGVPDGLLVAMSGALLADDAVHLRAVYGWRTLDRANGEQVGVAACSGVGECRTGGGQGIEIVGQERPAYFDRSASVDVVGGDDAPSTASRDPRLRYQFVNEVVDAARVELLGRVDNPPVPLVRRRAKENVDVAVTPGFEDTQRRVCENGPGLRVVVHDANRRVVDAVSVADVTWANLNERLGEELPIQGEQLFGFVRDAEFGEKLDR